MIYAKNRSHASKPVLGPFLNFLWNEYLSTKEYLHFIPNRVSFTFGSFLVHIQLLLLLQIPRKQNLSTFYPNSFGLLDPLEQFESKLRAVLACADEITSNERFYRFYSNSIGFIIFLGVL